MLILVVGFNVDMTWLPKKIFFIETPFNHLIGKILQPALLLYILLAQDISRASLNIDSFG